MVRLVRRPDGSLEHEVLSVLWAEDGPLTAAEVLDRLETPLAYTSIATVLSRLFDKGLVARTLEGRAFAYRATKSESDLIADRMRVAVSASSDSREVLARFLGKLSRRDLRELRRLMNTREFRDR